MKKWLTALSAVKSSTMGNTAWHIGWDVGAWHCLKGKTGKKPRDAIVILNSNLEIVGTPWRGNLREAINSCSTTGEWSAALFNLCRLSPQSGSITLAIDAPLGFSDAFRQLVTKLSAAASIESNQTNPYLFRRTERYLFKRGFYPLSAITQQIGSQATKGMHVLARFAPNVVDCGVWSGRDGSDLTVIETYPAPCFESKTIKELLEHDRYSKFSEKDDRKDALICALVAQLFAEAKSELVPPEQDVSPSEGWIWVPKDALFLDDA